MRLEEPRFDELCDFRQNFRKMGDGFGSIIGRTAQGRRGSFAEESPVDGGEPSQFPEPVSRGNSGDRTWVRFGLAQCTPDHMHPPQQQKSFRAMPSCSWQHRSKVRSVTPIEVHSSERKSGWLRLASIAA